LSGALAPDEALAFVSLNVSPDLATHPDNVTSDDFCAGAGAGADGGAGGAGGAGASWA
jgi:hypothetical protein